MVLLQDSNSFHKSKLIVTEALYPVPVIVEFRYTELHLQTLKSKKEAAGSMTRRQLLRLLSLKIKVVRVWTETVIAVKRIDLSNFFRC